MQSGKGSRGREKKGVREQGGDGVRKQGSEGEGAREHRERWSEEKGE